MRKRGRDLAPPCVMHLARDARDAWHCHTSRAEHRAYYFKSSSTCVTFLRPNSTRSPSLMTRQGTLMTS